jgi:3-mercaptopyruvate sulfurtransferase SseA
MSVGIALPMEVRVLARKLVFAFSALSMAVLLLTSCTTKPTRMHDNQQVHQLGTEHLLEPIKIVPETIVVDARISFDYSMSHIPHSVSLQWADFTEPEKDQKGVIQGDHFAVTRRLARYGIGPDVPVVVVGHGLKGEGEEGRIAWTLTYLGVKKVQFADIDSLGVHQTNVTDENPPKSVPIWKPAEVESLNVARAELQNVMNKNGVNQPIPPPGGGQPVLYRIIDVRSESAYLGKTGLGVTRKIPDMGAINIPWKNFFTESLRPDFTILKKLAHVGISPENRIIVIDENGISSAAVTMVLRAMDFPQAGNYAGGLTDLLSAYPAPAR